jgi:hypothetical protein
VVLVGGNPFGGDYVTSIALDATYVYWAGSSGLGGVVARVPKTGGAFEQVAMAMPETGQVAVDATSVYYSDLGGIHSVPHNGPPTLVALVSAPHFALSGAFLYWTDAAGVWKVPTGGGTPTQVVSVSTSPGPIAVVGSTIYWADGAGIMKVLVSGGPVTMVGPWAMAPQGLAADDSWVAVAYPQLLLQVPTDPNSGAHPEILSDVGGPSAVAMDATTVYFTENGFNAGLQKVLIGSGPSVALAIHGTAASEAGIAVDATDIYWSSDTSILKMAK